ncbi:MAG: carbon-nitrogen hydrolase family protein [Roseovarius sp.]
MTRSLTVATLQTRPMPSFQAAWDESRPLAEKAVESGAKVLFLPEYCGGLRTKGAAVDPPCAPEAKHPFLNNAKAFAAEHKVWMNLGSIAVDGPDGRIANRGYMLSPAGEITGHYDKIHLFDIQLSDNEIYRESDTVSPGACAVIHDTGLAKIGHTICYDLRFPHLFRRLAQSGAEILCCPAAFTAKTGAAHWHVLTRARAIETTCFIISAGLTGSIPGGGETYGHSLIVDPWGTVLGDGGSGPGCVMATLDLDLIARTQARIPSLANEVDFAPPS